MSVVLTEENKNLEQKKKIFIGVDFNTTGHIVVVADPSTGKVWKLGKEVRHLFLKYRHLKKQLESRGHYNKARQLQEERRDNIMENILHHISKKIVEVAESRQAGIRLEKLPQIHERKRWRQRRKRTDKFSLSNKLFYLLRLMVEYKAEQRGIVIEYVAPEYTSQLCSRCAHIGKRDGKKFKCRHCGHLDHADVNSAFNIAQAVCYCVLDHNRQGHESILQRQTGFVGGEH